MCSCERVNCKTYLPPYTRVLLNIFATVNAQTFRGKYLHALQVRNCGSGEQRDREGAGRREGGGEDAAEGRLLL